MQNDLAKPHQARIVFEAPKPAARPGGPRGHQTVRAAPSCFVLGHDSRLGQVFTNLLDNARSFAPEGSLIKVTLAREAGWAVVTVEDDGPGIPEHAQERIFERFYTDRPVEQGFGQNSGLGLSISRQIVEAHRGSIAASNRLAPDGAVAGACFTVRLPLLGGGP
jgi:two-component system, OmpR family, sensor histidine kinase ChvG